MKDPKKFKYDFCRLYFHMTDGDFTYNFKEIPQILGYKIDSSNPNEVVRTLVNKYGLLKRNEIKFIRTKRFVNRSFYNCPVSGDATDYLLGDTKNDYIKAERNLLNAFNTGRLLRRASSMKANSGLSNNKLKLRFLIESVYKTKTICSRCEEIKNWDDMFVNKGVKQRTCIECITPVLRKNAKQKAKEKRDSLEPGEHARKQREYLKNNPDKKIKYKEKSLETQKKGRAEGKYKYPNNPMVTQIHRLLKRVIKQLGTVKENSTVEELGYNSKQLHSYIGDKNNPTDQLDHLIPINWFTQGTPFSIVNNLHNLKYTTQNYNSVKQNFWFDEVPVEFFNICKPYIKNNFLNRFIICGSTVYDKHFGVYEPSYFV